MSAAQKDNGFRISKGSIVAILIFGAILAMAAVYSLFRIVNKSGLAAGDESAPYGAISRSQTNFITEEEIEKQHAMYRPPPPVAATVATTTAVAPTNSNNDEVMLRKAKARVNNMIVERQKKYIKDHPSRDHRALEKQIKIRENSGAQIQ